MSSKKIIKSHSETYSFSNNNQMKINGGVCKRNLLNQEGNKLKENHSDKEKKRVHSISICINTFDENLNEHNMRQEFNNPDNVSEINNLGSAVNQIKIDEESKQPTEVSTLSNNDHCDSKDKKRTKHLVRCEAVRESSLSPPPQNLDPNQVNSNKVSYNNTNHLTVYNKNVTVKNSLKCNSSSNSATTSPSLSRDSSTENNLEYSIPELKTFLSDTLKRNQKDRMFLLRVEQEIIQFVKDDSKESHKFTSTSSYNRLLIHRVAAYFGLDHNVDHTHSSVIVTKTKNTAIPEFKLKDLTKDDESCDEPKKSILKRDSTSFEDSSGGSFDKDKSPESHLNGSLSDSSRSRSLEEREENYERVRARIFNNASNNHSIELKDDTEESNSSKVVTEAEDKIDIVASVPQVDTKKTQSSPNNESHNECDKIKNGLLPNKSPLSSSNNQGKNNHETRKTSNNHNRNDGNNRNKHNNCKKSNSYSDQNNRYQNRKNNEHLNKATDNDWALKPNPNTKQTSQNMPYNLLYPNYSVDGPFFPRYSTLNPLNLHSQNSGHFPVGTHYMQPPILPNEQLFPPVNSMNFVSPMLPLINQVNVPNSMLNQISYNNHGVNSSFPSNIPMNANYQNMMYNNMQPVCGPYPPSTNIPTATAQNYNSLLGLPYQQYQPLSVNNFMQNIPSNLKTMSEFDKAQMNVNFSKPSFNYPTTSAQYPGQEALDRSFQYNAPLLQAAELFMNNRTPIHPNHFPVNFSNVNNKRLANEMVTNNPTLLQQAQPSIYFNQQQKSLGSNLSKSNSGNNKYSNYGRNNKRGGPNSSNSNRKY